MRLFATLLACSMAGLFASVGAFAAGDADSALESPAANTEEKATSDSEPSGAVESPEMSEGVTHEFTEEEIESVDP